MMKRFLAAGLLAALLLPALVSTALSSTTVTSRPTLAADVLKFRTHRASYTAGTQGVFSDLAGNSFDAVDSVITNRLGTQTMVLDTTTAVNTSAWPRPENVALALSAADTNFVWCTLNVYDNAGTSSSTADSLYICAQASYDGVSWFTLATLAGATAASVNSRLDQTQGTGTFFGVLNKLGASGSTPTWVWAYKLRTPNTQVADQTAIWKYPLLRWIIGFPDAVNYSVRAQVFHNTVESGL